MAFALLIGEQMAAHPAFIDGFTNSHEYVDLALFHLPEQRVGVGQGETQARQRRLLAYPVEQLAAEHQGRVFVQGAAIGALAPRIHTKLPP